MMTNEMYFRCSPAARIAIFTRRMMIMTIPAAINRDHPCVCCNPLGCDIWLPQQAVCSVVRSKRKGDAQKSNTGREEHIGDRQYLDDIDVTGSTTVVAVPLAAGGVHSVFGGGAARRFNSTQTTQQQKGPACACACCHRAAERDIHATKQTLWDCTTPAAKSHLSREYCAE